MTLGSSMSNAAARVVIAGLRGGSGKTTLSLGLIKVLRDKGVKIRAFKKGPDYIDAGWLAAASGCNCYNLDPYLFPAEKIIESFQIHCRDSDCALVEGNRGLYDGMDVEGTYSTAELAKLLKSPVLIVIDCTKATRTLSAVVLGMISFDRDVDIRGVILNNISGERHEAVVRGAIEKYTPLKVLGAIRRLRSGRFPERHMGLTPHHEHPEVMKAIEEMGRIVRDSVDCDRVLEIGLAAGDTAGMSIPDRGSGPGAVLHGVEGPASGGGRGVRIGIIKDMAFQFYYPDNLEALVRAGAELVEVSALREDSLPAMDALYIGGGFPETNAIALSENGRFMSSLREAVELGLPVYAECGGLMYLGREIELGGRLYPMASILPVSFRMEDSPVAHGYTEVEVAGKNPYFPEGLLLKGHEFHYSRVVRCGDGLRMVFSMRRGKGIEGGLDGIVYKNVLATYTHLHALGAPQWAEGMIKAAAAFGAERRALQ